MNKVTLIFALLSSQLLFAALPPVYQNKKDLQVMMQFIESHPKVLSELKSIDVANKVIHFGDDCQAIFKRKNKKKPLGWVGPAAQLKFISTSCDLK